MSIHGVTRIHSHVDQRGFELAYISLDEAKAPVITSPPRRIRTSATILFVGLFREDGRDGLFDTRLSRRHGAETVVETLTSVEQLAHTLDDVVGIDPYEHRFALTRIMKEQGCD